MNGLFENVTKLNRGTTIQNEIDELIPGSIAGKLRRINIKQLIFQGMPWIPMTAKTIRFFQKLHVEKRVFTQTEKRVHELLLVDNQPMIVFIL